MTKKPQTQGEPSPDTDGELSEAELDEISGGINDLDTMNDATELMQMRTQQYLERRSKALETLTNAVKKMSATGDNITKNMK